MQKASEVCDINIKTAFKWRHPFLQVPCQLKASVLQGIVEVDETLFRRSEKGSRQFCAVPPQGSGGSRASLPGRFRKDWVTVLTARDRDKKIFEAIVPAVSSEQITSVLEQVMTNDSVLCSDHWNACCLLASKKKSTANAAECQRRDTRHRLYASHSKRQRLSQQVEELAAAFPSSSDTISGQLLRLASLAGMSIPRFCFALALSSTTIYGNIANFIPKGVASGSEICYKGSSIFILRVRTNHEQSLCNYRQAPDERQ